MSFRYKRQTITYVVDGYEKAIRDNQQRIIDVIASYAEPPISSEDQKTIIREIILAARNSVAAVVDDGPNKADNKWKESLNSIRKTLIKLENLDFSDLVFLDSGLRTDEDTYQLLKHYGRIYGSPEDSALTLGELKTHLIKSLMLMDYLLVKSLEGVSVGRSPEREPLIRYCYGLYSVFKKYTGRGLTLNSPFEKFAWQCIEPLQGIIKHSYSEESLKKSIRWLKDKRGAEIGGL